MCAWLSIAACLKTWGSDSEPNSSPFSTGLKLIDCSVQSSEAAYQNLSDRAAQIQQIGMSLEGYVMQQRTETVRATQAGRTLATNVFDVLCIFDPNSCHTANQLRGEMVDEVNDASQTGYGSILAQLKAQLGNPQP